MKPGSIDEGEPPEIEYHALVAAQGEVSDRRLEDRHARDVEFAPNLDQRLGLGRYQHGEMCRRKRGLHARARVVDMDMAPADVDVGLDLPRGTGGNERGRPCPR